MNTKSKKATKPVVDTTKPDTIKALLMFIFIIALRIAVIAGIIWFGFFIVEQIKNSSEPSQDYAVQTA